MLTVYHSISQYITLTVLAIVSEVGLLNVYTVDCSQHFTHGGVDSLWRSYISWSTMLISFSRHTHLSLSWQKTGQCWVLQESSSDIPHQVEWSAYYAGVCCVVGAEGRGGGGRGERRKENRKMGGGEGKGESYNTRARLA